MVCKKYDLIVASAHTPYTVQTVQRGYVQGKAMSNGAMRPN